MKKKDKVKEKAHVEHKASVEESDEMVSSVSEDENDSLPSERSRQKETHAIKGK